MGTAFESAQRAEGPTVSVVVVSHNTPRTLEKCLASLSRQPAAEIFVVDCSDRDPGASLAARFPAVEFRHFAEKLAIPEMRREGMRASHGEIVALTESWMVPCPGWVESLRQAHGQYPDVPVVGGPIAFPCGALSGDALPSGDFPGGDAPAGGAAATRLEWADYFSEYGEHIPSPEDGQEVSSAERISGANCSYKRWALEDSSDLVDQGAWEPVIHGRLRERGYELKRAPAAWVCYQKPGSLGKLLRQRFCYGRGHAVEQGRGKPWIERLARGVAAPLVPWVLLWRLWRGLPRTPSLRARFLVASGWILALNAAWALGEAAGSWFGPARRNIVI